VAEEKSLEPYHQSVNEILEELNKVHGPYWRSRNELAKLLVSLSSAALVLTVTFSKDLAANVPQGWKASLFLCWISFAMSTIAGVISLWASTKFYTLQIMFFNQREEMKKRIDEMKKQGKFQVELFQDLFLWPFSKLSPYDKAAGLAINAGLGLFVLALIFLSLFGWKAFTT